MLQQFCFLFGGYTCLLLQNPVVQSGKSASLGSFQQQNQLSPQEISGGGKTVRIGFQHIDTSYFYLQVISHSHSLFMIFVFSIREKSYGWQGDLDQSKQHLY